MNRTRSHRRAMLRPSAHAQVWAALILGAWTALLGVAFSTSSFGGQGSLMPEFSNRSPQAWINSKPLSRADLQGKVVLLEVYASG